MITNTGEAIAPIFDHFFDHLPGYDSKTRRDSALLNTPYTTPSGLVVVGTEIYVAGDRPFSVSSTGGMVEFSFLLEGGGEVKMDDLRFGLKSSYCTMTVMRNFSATLRYTQDATFRSLAIAFPLGLFDHYMSMPGRLSDGITCDRLLGKRSTYVQSFAIAPGVRREITALMLLDNEAEPLRGIRLESKSLELLALCIEQLFMDRTLAESAAYSELGRADRQKILQARDIVCARLSAPPSLLELARLVGLNDYKLKLGFRQMFGQSVYGYLRDQRMEIAWGALKRGECNVSQAATLVGYTNFSHFATAFRKRYGMNPSRLSRQ